MDASNEQTTDKIKQLAEKAGWGVYIESQDGSRTCYDFSKGSPAGQDFHVSAEMEGMDIGTLMESLEHRYNGFDCSEETYLWLDSTGHGRNGAPYDMKDLYEDMEACQEMIMELYHVFEEAQD